MSQEDRSNTNNNALLTTLKATVRHTYPLQFFCSHKINNRGKKSIGAEGYTTINAEEFSKFFNQLMQFKVSTREHFTEMFSGAPKTSGEIRLSEKFEQVWKINVFGVMKIMDEVVPVCVRQKGYEVTANKK